TIHHIRFAKADVDLLEFPLNLEFFEAEFFYMGGSTPLGAKKANLDHFTQDVILQFAYQEVGHLRAIQKVVKGFPRPLLDLSKESFAKTVDLSPPFDPYYNGVHFLLASYLIPYVGLTGYVEQFQNSKPLVLEGVESGQDAVIRAYLYEHAKEIVSP
ncbi:desiccation-related protein pcc13-62, partial [Quercus suber]